MQIVLPKRKVEKYIVQPISVAFTGEKGNVLNSILDKWPSRMSCTNKSSAKTPSAFDYLKTSLKETGYCLSKSGECWAKYTEVAMNGRPASVDKSESLRGYFVKYAEGFVCTIEERNIADRLSVEEKIELLREDSLIGAYKESSDVKHRESTVIMVWGRKNGKYKRI